jgi:small subunit ribosomal protein S6
MFPGAIVHKERSMTEANAAKKMRYREYETIYLMKPDVSKEAAAKIAQRIDELVKREGSKLVQVETWGRRQLAFSVGRFRRAVYVYLKYIGTNTVVAELERTFRMLDEVIKYQTIVKNANVDIAEIAVDPEAVKFEELNLPEDVEDEKALERALGFIDPEPGQRRHRSGDGLELEENELEALREMEAENFAGLPVGRENAQ